MKYQPKGSMCIACKNYSKDCNKRQVNPDWRWTPYTDEAWSELNKS